jgi:hemoglobin
VEPGDAQTLYEAIGGELPLRQLVDRFYDRMDALPEAAVIRAMHATNLQTSRDKLFWFLSGWMGGPQLYVQRFGHPRLRARHMPFAIDDDAAAQWMHCMQGALDEVVGDERVRQEIASRLARVALHMRNRTWG